MRERRSGAIATCSRRDSQSPPHSVSLEALPSPEQAPLLLLLLVLQAGRKIKKEGCHLPTINIKA